MKHEHITNILLRPKFTSLSLSGGKIFLSLIPTYNLLNNMESHEVCKYCLKKCKTLKKCGKCRSVSYCSAEHQKLDWKTRGHKLVCDELARVKTNHCQGTADEFLRADIAM